VAADARSRTVILALACLAHVGVILLLTDSIAVVRYRVPAQESEPLLLTLLESLVRPEPVPAEVPAPALTPPSEIVIGPLPQIDSTGSAFAPPVSDSVPEVDWIDERRREVQNVVARQAGENARTSAGKGAGRIALPAQALEHKAGVVEHSAGGRTIEWVNDRCYYSNERDAIRNPFGLMLPTCKRPGNVARKELRLDKRVDEDE
jgi:hypothetical protein